MWDFLTDPQNQQTLSWLGGGFAVGCGGLWAVLKFVLDRKGPKGTSGGTAGGGASAPRGEAASLLADRGGLAAGRDIRIEQRSGVPPLQLVLIVLALVGALVFAVSQAGNRVTVSNGVGIGGNVNGSSINSQ